MTENWLERYCAEVVTALRDQIDDIDGDVEHEAWWPDEGDPGEPHMTFQIMYTHPDTDVHHFAWSPSEGWTYKLDEQTWTDEGIPLRNESGRLVHHTDTADAIAYAASETITENMHSMHPEPQIRKMIEDHNDDASVAVFLVVELHKPEYSRTRREWTCTGCVGSDELPAPYPCPTIATLRQGFSLDVI